MRWGNRCKALIGALTVVVLLSACSNASYPKEESAAAAQMLPTAPEHTEAETIIPLPEETIQPGETTVQEEGMEQVMLRIEIGENVLFAELADTSAAQELRNRLEAGSITVSVSNYGGWEKVGSLPWSLPRNDIQTTAVPGDIMLYSGNQIVIFYGTNSWAYTRLASIVEEDIAHLQTILSGSEDTVTIGLA